MNGIWDAGMHIDVEFCEFMFTECVGFHVFLL
jgi:hypothetical protein